MLEEQVARERASICKDCWFFRELSCALPSPTNGACANKRAVRGRQALPKLPQQAALTPMADVAMPAVAAASEPVAAPFTTASPEATFSLAQVRDEPRIATAPAQDTLPTFEQPVRVTPPSFREIRAGRAAAAARVPVAEVRIPVAALEAQPSLPGMDALVERVRQRTAARLSHAAASRSTPGSI